MLTDELATVAGVDRHTISENSTDPIPDKRSARIPDIAYAWLGFESPPSTHPSDSNPGVFLGVQPTNQSRKPHECWVFVARPGTICSSDATTQAISKAASKIPARSLGRRKSPFRLFQSLC